MSGKLKPDVQSLGYSPANPTRRTIAKFGKVWASYCLFTFGLLLYLSLPYTFNHRRNATPSRNPAYLIKAENGVVASENIVCSEIGVNVLKDGGSAVDAAIASTFCVGVINMFSSGIGGGGFMTVRIPPTSPNASSEVYTIDFRETAPALSNTTMFHDNPIAAKWSGLAVGVPSELRGLEEAHKRWGKLSWERLVQPSAELARGWRIDAELGFRIKLFEFLMLGHQDWQPTFAPNGILLQEGDFINRTAYARTLSIIAKEGPSAFYSGHIAESIVRKVHSEGGILSLADLADYKVVVKKALEGTYRGRKIYTTHAPTSGPVLLHMLNLLEHYDFEGEGRTGLNVHRAVEALKFAFGARTQLSDPAFSNQTDVIDLISTKEFADLVSANLTDDRTHPPEYYNPEFAVSEDHGTMHVSVVDKDEMAVALTSTVNLIFGSWILDQETGIILNDEMDDFSIPDIPNGFGLYPSPYNFPEPGKRPLSSTVPTIIENSDGSFLMALGGAGGSRIFGAAAQVILSYDWGLDLSAAVEYGRFHDQLYPLEVDIDNIYPKHIIDDLKQRGHNVTVADVNRIAGVINAVSKQNGSFYGASDSRKNGIAAGY